MKHFLVFIVIVSLSSINCNSQTYYGFKVGANLSNIYGDNSFSGIKPAMHVGAVAEIALSDFFSLQPELLYSMQGSQTGSYQNNDNPELPYYMEDVKTGSFKNNNHYVILPIMVRYFVTDMISIDAGPQVGYLLFAKKSDGKYEWTDTKDSMNTFDYGINLGASYEFDNGMNVNLRYSYGLANIYKTENDITLKGNNAVAQISLGYKFY